MSIQIKCYATLARRQPDNAESFPIEPGETVGQLLERLSIPPGELKLVFVNGTHADLNRVLVDGDRVGLFPAVGGG